MKNSPRKAHNINKGGLRFVPGASPHAVEPKAAPVPAPRAPINKHGLWFAPKEVETKPAAPPAIPAREMTLEQFRQMYFPELVGEIQASNTDAVADRNAA